MADGGDRVSTPSLYMEAKAPICFLKGGKVTAGDIQRILLQRASFHNIYVPEFTWGDLRIDAMYVDTVHKWIRGFEVKVDRNDFNKDKKWTLYTRFLSSLTIICPKGLIQSEEIEKPFGLMWVSDENDSWGRRLEVKKRAVNFQKRKSLAWLWTYVSVLEHELPRMQYELQSLAGEVQRLREREAKRFDLDVKAKGGEKG